MSRERILASLVVTILLGTPVEGATQASRPLGEFSGLIRGKGRDAVGPVSGLKVSVKSLTTKRDVVTDASGEYEIELPVGIQTITANLPEYYPYRRAPFRVRPGAITIINLNLILVGIDRVHGGGKDLHYEELSVPNATDELLDVLVAYYDRKKNDRYVAYEGIRLYYDVLPVHAAKFQLDKRDFTVKATGKPQLTTVNKAMFTSEQQT